MVRPRGGVVFSLKREAKFWGLLVAQWLRLRASRCRGLGLIPALRTQSPHVSGAAKKWANLTHAVTQRNPEDVMPTESQSQVIIMNFISRRVPGESDP